MRRGKKPEAYGQLSDDYDDANSSVDGTEMKAFSAPRSQAPPLHTTATHHNDELHPLTLGPTVGVGGVGVKELSWTENLTLALKYVHSTSKKHRRSYFVGLATVFLVVMFVSILQNTVLLTPYIFLQLAESRVGEMDLMMTPKVDFTDPLMFLRFANENSGTVSDDEAAPFDDIPALANLAMPVLNYTNIDELLHNNTDVFGATPRWMFLGSIANRDDPSLKQSAWIFVIDSDNEMNVGVGRGWPYRALGENEVHATSSLLRAVDVRANMGDRVVVDLGFAKLFKQFNISNAFIKNALLAAAREQLRNGFNGTLSLQDMFQSLGFPAIPFESIPEAFMPQGIDSNGDLTPEFIQALIEQYLDLDGLIQEATNSITDGGALGIECTMIDSVWSHNKWPQELGNAVVMESKHLMTSLASVVGALPLVSALSSLQYATAIRNYVKVPANTPASGPARPTPAPTPAPLLSSPADGIVSGVRNFPIHQYAFIVIVQSKNRAEQYSQSSSQIKIDLTHFADSVVESLGVDFKATYSLPISSALAPFLFLRMFLDQVFLSVVAVIILLGCMAIYSLVQSGVTERTYEFGMLRALGLKQSVLVQLLLMQSLYFAFPGIAVGLLVAFLVSIPITNLVADFALVHINLGLHQGTLITALCIGLLLPVLGNIVPIRRALSHTLSASLNVYHQLSQDTQVRWKRLADLRLSVNETTVALTLVILGGVVYYVIPVSFIFQQYDLLLTVLNSILLGMLAGLTLLAIGLQPSLERGMLWLMLWGNDRTLKTIVTKNLCAHRDRSRKTALMFTTSLAFIIFAGSMFGLQATSITDNLRMLSGSDITVFSPDTPLDEDGLTAFLQAMMNKTGSDRLVESFCFSTFSLYHVDPPIWHTYVQNLVSFPKEYSIGVFGLPSNFLDVSYSDYFSTTSISSEVLASNVSRLDSGEPNLFEFVARAPRPAESNRPPLIISHAEDDSPILPTEFGLDAIVAASFDPVLFANVETDFLLRVPLSDEKYNHQETLFLMTRPQALVKKLPGFLFSSYAPTFEVAAVILSMEQYTAVMDRAIDVVGLNRSLYPEKYFKQRLFVRLTPAVNTTEREDLINGIRTLITDDKVFVVDTVGLVEGASGVVGILLLFFNIVAVLASCLCFFILWTSFDTNVRENLWEFGVLRATGLSSKRLVRVFVYEALSLILSAVLLGTAVGLILACTLTLQQDLFTEMPFGFSFPGSLFFSVLLLSGLVAFLGSFLAAARYRNMPIALVLKGNT